METKKNQPPRDADGEKSARGAAALNNNIENVPQEQCCSAVHTAVSWSQTYRIVVSHTTRLACYAMPRCWAPHTQHKCTVGVR
jgi:hypothetical protein